MVLHPCQLVIKSSTGFKSPQRFARRMEVGHNRSRCALTFTASFWGVHSSSLTYRAICAYGSKPGGAIDVASRSGMGLCWKCVPLSSWLKRISDLAQQPGPAVFTVRRNAGSVKSAWAEMCMERVKGSGSDSFSCAYPAGAVSESFQRQPSQRLLKNISTPYNIFIGTTCARRKMKWRHTK